MNFNFSFERYFSSMPLLDVQFQKERTSFFCFNVKSTVQLSVVPYTYILSLGRSRQEGCEVETSLGYIANLSPTQTIQQDSVSKNIQPKIVNKTKTSQKSIFYPLFFNLLYFLDNLKNSTSIFSSIYQMEPSVFLLILRSIYECTLGISV